jgi:hypothetical protein
VPLASGTDASTRVFPSMVIAHQTPAIPASFDRIIAVLVPEEGPPKGS